MIETSINNRIELPVDTEFQYGDYPLKVVESEMAYCCDECFFKTKCIEVLSCMAHERKDSTSVVFKEIL